MTAPTARAQGRLRRAVSSLVRRRESRPARLFEDNPLVQQLNVRPSEFEQNQFTTRLDGRLTKSNTLSGTFFFSNFPALDSFPDPSSLISPFVLRRADRNRTLAISDQHVFGPTLINEARFGFFLLNNTRTLDERVPVAGTDQQGAGHREPGASV